MSSSPKTAVLFICLGNICRSPLAEGIFRHVVNECGMAEQFLIDSAATGTWHIGNPPDSRAIAVAGEHGLDISTQRCRRIVEDDFHRFDIIFCMDHANLANVLAMRPSRSKARIELFLQYALGKDQPVPDPYLDHSTGFEQVYQLINQASPGLLAKLSP
jgi:protein-tyrosine phosphatase